MLDRGGLEAVGLTRTTGRRGVVDEHARHEAVRQLRDVRPGVGYVRELPRADVAGLVRHAETLIVCVPSASRPMSARMRPFSLDATITTAIDGDGQLKSRPA